MTLQVTVVSILIIFMAAVVYCVAPGKMTPEAKKAAQDFYGLNCAHRGLYTENQQVPENSMPAFIAARDGGYGVELDVQLSKDGQTVVFHDKDLKRACGIDATVGSLDWKELSALPLFGTRECMPLLSDVLDTLGDTPVIVELKPTGVSNVKLCEETLKIIRARGRRLCVESFDPRICAWFRKNAPDLLRGQLSCPPREIVGLSKVSALILGNLLINYMSRPHFIAYSNTPRPLTVRLCHAMKPMKVIWTVQPKHDIAQCEKENDTVIFEHHTPVPRYREV
jgi:glycerophosphoryl diester phosphodiesterase